MLRLLIRGLAFLVVSPFTFVRWIASRTRSATPRPERAAAARHASSSSLRR